MDALLYVRDRMTEDARTHIFCSACKDGRHDVVEAFVHHVSDDARQSAFVRAASEGDVHVVRAVLEAGADIEKGNNNGWTPLMEACSKVTSRSPASCSRRGSR